MVVRKKRRPKSRHSIKRPKALDFKTLFENAPTPYVVLDRSFNIVAVSEAYLRATLTTRSDVIGRQLFDVFPDNPDDPSATGVRALSDSINRVISSKKPDAMAIQKYDIRQPSSAGGRFEVRYWSPLNTPVIENGKVKYVIHRVIDVTQAVTRTHSSPKMKRKGPVEAASGPNWELMAEFLLKETKALSELRQREGDFQTIINSIQPLAWTANADGYIHWYNKRWYEYTGKTPEQMEGWGWQSVHDPKLLPEVMERWKRSLTSGEPFEMEFPLRSKTGKFHWFLTRVLPVRDKDGRITQWFGSNTDVDEIRSTRERLLESERQLRISEERMRLAQQAAKIGGWEFEFDTDEYIFSEQALEILGRSVTLRRVSESDFLSMMYVAADREAAIKAMSNSLTKKREYDVSFRVQKHEGEWRWITARGVPFFNQGKHVMVGVFIDITDARNAQPERKPA